MKFPAAELRNSQRELHYFRLRLIVSGGVVLGMFILLAVTNWAVAAADGLYGKFIAHIIFSDSDS